MNQTALIGLAFLTVAGCAHQPPEPEPEAPEPVYDPIPGCKQVRWETIRIEQQPGRWFVPSWALAPVCLDDDLE